MRQETMKLTAFITSDGLYEFNVILLGKHTNGF